jgi:hypothetical protein
MTTNEWARTTARWTLAGIGLTGASYAAYVAVTWLRYGHVASPGPAERDTLLDTFMPNYDIRERHDTRVAAPAAVTLAVARDLALLDLPVVRAVVRGRELILRATADRRARPHALIAEMQSIGWGVLADVPEREIVMGAVTRPWDANVVFRPLPPADFASFHEPGYIKIPGRCGRMQSMTTMRSFRRKRARSPPTRWHGRSSAPTGRSSRPESS